MTALAFVVIFVAGDRFRWAINRAEQRARFQRSIARFGTLTKDAETWRTEQPRWADDVVIDLRDGDSR